MVRRTEVTAPYSLTLFAPDGSILSTTSYETKAELQINVLLSQARIDRRAAESDGRIPCRFDVTGVDYDEWRAWIK
jgi:hypothetical protein